MDFTGAPHVVNGTAELWQVEFRDPDGNQLALMSEAQIGGT